MGLLFKLFHNRVMPSNLPVLVKPPACTRKRLRSEYFLSVIGRAFRARQIRSQPLHMIVYPVLVSRVHLDVPYMIEMIFWRWCWRTFRCV
jgi:hypothetical protein